MANGKEEQFQLAEIFNLTNLHLDFHFKNQIKYQKMI